jgi:hypothetical protein
LNKIDLLGCRKVTDVGIIAIANNCEGLREICVIYCDITDTAIIALADRCKYLEIFECAEDNGLDLIPLRDNPKVTATGRRLVEDIINRPKPPPLEAGWWLDDGTGPQCKGMMN